MCATNPFVTTVDNPAWPLCGGDGTPPAGRLELKYCVPEQVAKRVLDVARPFLVPDVLAQGPRQRVTSLYLDTANLTFLRWHRERAGDRFKLRIRRYGELPAPTLYAELKRKTESVVRKRRAAFPAAALRAVIEGAGLPDTAPSLRDASNLREFASHRRESGAMPRMLVTCIRESLRDPDDGTAVTVDRSLQYQPTRSVHLTGDECAWRPIPLPCTSEPATAIVELKYGVLPPPWMDALIGQLTPWRVSFSKYAAAMNECAVGEM